MPIYTVQFTAALCVLVFIPVVCVAQEQCAEPGFVSPGCTECVANKYRASSLQEVYRTGGVTLEFGETPTFVALDGTPEPAYLPYPSMEHPHRDYRGDWTGPDSPRPSYSAHGGIDMRPAVSVNLGQYLDAGGRMFRYNSGGGLTFTANVRFDVYEDYYTGWNAGYQRQNLLVLSDASSYVGLHTQVYVEFNNNVDKMMVVFRFLYHYYKECTVKIPVEAYDLEWKFIVATLNTETATMTLSVDGISESKQFSLPPMTSIPDMVLDSVLVGREHINMGNRYAELYRLFDICRQPRTDDKWYPYLFCPTISALGGSWLNATIAGLFVVDQLMDADTIHAHIDPQTGQLYNHGHAVCVACPANSKSSAGSTNADACVCQDGWRNKNKDVSNGVTVCVPT